MYVYIDILNMLIFIDIRYISYIFYTNTRYLYMIYRYTIGVQSLYIIYIIHYTYENYKYGRFEKL